MAYFSSARRKRPRGRGGGPNPLNDRQPPSYTGPRRPVPDRQPGPYAGPRRPLRPMSDTRRPRRKRKPQGDIQASFEQGGPLSRYNERSTKRLRARHRELGNKSKFPELAEGTEDKRRKQIAAVLRNRSLRGQFGSDWRQKAYGDISGYKPGLADRIGAEKGSEAPDEEKLSSMREAFAELRKRRRSYSPGQRYDSGTGEFVPRHGRPKRRGGKDEGRQMVTRGRRRRRRGRRRVSASFEPR